MKNAKLLSKAEMKNVKGGDYNTCYNICMAGYNGSASDTEKKVLACDNLCSGQQTT